MKKLLFSLMAATLCLMIASCSSSSNKIKSIAEDIKNNGNEWTDPDQWERAADDFFVACCEFGESNFSEDEAKEFAKACMEVVDAFDNIDNKAAQKALAKGLKKLGDNDELGDRLKEAFKKGKERLEELELDPEDLVSESDLAKAYGLAFKLMK